MDSSQIPLYLLYGVVTLFALGTILSGFFQVMTAEAVVPGHCQSAQSDY